MILSTTATSTDWVWANIEIREDMVEYFQSFIDKPEQYSIFSQGISEGWIVVVGEE